MQRNQKKKLANEILATAECVRGYDGTVALINTRTENKALILGMTLYNVISSTGGLR